MELKIDNKFRSTILLVLFIMVIIINSNKINFQPSRAHSSISYPSEIFSIWEDSLPTVDGIINFEFNSSLITEWGNASVYTLYNSTNEINGKFLLQNDNSALYIAVDAVNFVTQFPTSDWGLVFYFDIDHNGYLNAVDKSIRFIHNSSDYVEYRGYNSNEKSWVIEETGSLGTPLTNNILLNTDFTLSEFQNVTDHRQYEIKIPLITIASTAGRTIGFGLEVTEDFTDQSASITWPFIEDDLHYIRTKANTWCDLTLGEENKNNFQYIVENNLDVSSTAKGYNNGTFITSGDIDGNGDQELIVSSNRSVIGDNSLLTIFDYSGGEIYQNWTSWTTSHQSTITFIIRGLATHDFDGDGKDEIYAVGYNSRDILRFSGWDVATQDFATSEVVISYSNPLMGYIAIGDVTNDSQANLVFGDQNGNLVIYDYIGGGSFLEEQRSPVKTKINGIYPYRIHAVGIGNIDSDPINEILFNYQITADNQISETGLLIYERTEPKYQDNAGDDLSADSSPTTQDQFGHTIVVGDVDNDLFNEIVIVGKNYLRVFDNDSFTNPIHPLEFLLNDGVSKPSMAGGATIADLNNDGFNELIFGANNGTFYLGTVTDLGSTFNFNLNWSGDFGHSLGYHGSISTNDFDDDGKNEMVVGDNFGQILIFGKGQVPNLTIKSPNNNYVSSSERIIVTWQATDDLQSIHHFDIKVNGLFFSRAGGGQTNAVISLLPSQNNIEIIAYDFSGLSTSKNITVKFDVKAPQVTIISPENYFITDQSSVDISYSNFDPDDDFLYYTIYRNNSLIEDNTTDETYNVILPFDGVWNITVFALDDTGLYGRESVFVIKDTTGPTITITSPLDGAAVKVTNLEISWSASDEFSAIDRYDIYINSGFYQTVYSKSHIITITNDISYTIEIVAFDQLGNYNSDSITITRDTVAPTLTLDPIALPTLSDGTYYTENPSLFLSWNATDNASGTGISETKITRNGITIGTYLPTEISDTIDLGTDGLKDIVISTFDEAGNFAEVYFSIILDRTEPYIVIQTPENNSLTGLDYVIVSWSSDDAGVGIKEYEIIVDSIIIDTVANPTLSFYQVSLPDYRSYWITIRAIDYLDFSFEQSINITKSSSAPTINILNPANLYLYTNTTSLTISWDISNIDVNHFEILINGTSFDNYSSSTFSAIITFDVPLPGEYPLYNVTIYAIANDLKIYYDLRWIIIDQTPPSLNIIEPIFNDLIITTNLNVEWSSTDEGSSIKSFTLLLAGNSHFLGSTIISHVLDVTGLEGQYDLTIMAYDVAGNKIIQIIPITISLVAPGFITTLDSVIITNNPEIQFTLTINEPRLGVKSILIMLDETVEIFYENYEPTYITTEFSLLINITESNYVDGIDEHNLSISILDKIDRESNEQYSIIIDLEKPTFWQAPIIDTFLLVDEINEFILNNETSLNIHNVTVYILDGYGIENVYLTVTNENYTNILPMMRISGSHASQLFQYYVELNFNDMGAGEFSLIFNFEDIAGNSNIETYQIKLIASSQEPIPSPTPSTQNDPNNDFLYIIIAISVVVIASFIIVISLRRPISNLRWQNELVVFAYILKSGLTTIFIPYSYEIVTDEQLFGGAMSGIRGILEEIIGNKSKDEVESVEFGNKHLLIYSGKYGDNVLLVNKIKPIHSKLLKQFAEEFEEKYSNVLIDDTHVSMRDYVGASDIVEKYFGPVEDAESLSFKLSKIQRDKTKLEFDSSYKKETMVNSFYQEISSKYDSFDELSPETKVLIGDAIILAEQSVTDLISSEFKDAEKKAKTALKSLQIARERKEPLQKFNDIFSSLPSIIDEVIKGANCGKNNDIECVNRAIEIASQLFLERIMSRF